MLRIILLANWGLGLEILKFLHFRNDIDIKLVVTQYKKESRDRWYNVVYDFALQHNYKVVVQESISFEKLREFIVAFNIDLLVCHGYMKILPEKVFSAPKLGSINIHPSLLPKYRGPSPTYWVLKNREKTTGLTCHYIDEGVDTGNIIAQKEIVIEQKDTVESIIEKQKIFIDQLLHESLYCLMDSSIKPVPQMECSASYYPKPKKTEENIQ